MHEKRKHYRVAMREIKESPAEGIYVTNEELRKYSLYAGYCQELCANSFADSG